MRHVHPALAALSMMGLFLCASAQELPRVETIAQGFNASGDVAVGPNGNIFVANYGPTLSQSNGSQVLRITPDGVVSVFADGFAGATGNTFDDDGNLYQSNNQLGQVVRVDPEGNTSVYATGLAGGVIGLAFDSAGNLFAAGCGNNVIYRIDATTQQTTVFAQGGSLSCPNGMTADEDDNLYAVNFNNGVISRIDPQANITAIAQTPGGSFRPGGGNGHVEFGNGVLYVLSNASGQLYQVTLDGQLTVIAGDGTRGHVDGPALEASFQMPNGIDLSPDGKRIYLNESELTTGGQLTSNYPLTPNRLRVVILEEADPPFQINVGLSGGWFEQETAGQGLMLDINEDQALVFGAWFTYEPGQATKLGDMNHRWLTLQGNYADDTADLTIFATSGGVFDDPATTSTEAVGSATLSFSDCDSATLSYTIDSDSLSGEIALQRLIDSDLCEQLDLAATGTN